MTPKLKRKRDDLSNGCGAASTTGVAAGCATAAARARSSAWLACMAAVITSDSASGLIGLFRYS